MNNPMVRGSSRRPSMERSSQQEHCGAVIGTRPYKKVRPDTQE